VARRSGRCLVRSLVEGNLAVQGDRKLSIAQYPVNSIE
jgi:hypothetical protein